MGMTTKIRSLSKVSSSRNYTDLVASVYAADDTERTNPLWESQPQSGNKNFYSGDPKNPKSSIIYPTEWNGTDSEGNALADGRYFNTF